MTRNTIADKTIKGFYYQIIYAVHQLLLLEEEQKLACEISNSDFLVKHDEYKVSVEVKYYSNSIGWGDSAFKNTIRNFLDLENSNINDIEFLFLTSASQRNSPNINLWNSIKSGDETDIDKLIMELKILYISQTEEKTDSRTVRDNFEQYDSDYDFNINFESFIKRVNFKFDHKIEKDNILDEIKELNESLGNGNNLVADDLSAILYVLLDKLWISAMSDSDSAEKYISIDDVIDIINRREELLNEIKEKGYISEFQFAEEFFENVKTVFHQYFPEGNDIVKKFLVHFHRVTDILLCNYTKQEVYEFIKVLKNRFKLIQDEYTPQTHDLNELVSFLVTLSIAFEDDIIDVYLSKKNVIKNIGMNSFLMGLYEETFKSGSSKRRLVNFIIERFLNNPPEDIQNLSEEDIIVINGSERHFFCDGNPDEYTISANNEFLSKILSDISLVNDMNFDHPFDEENEGSLSDYICMYHCGKCCIIDEEESLEDNKKRIGRLLNND